MSNDPSYTGDIGAYPRHSQEGRPEPGGRKHAFMVLALSAAGVLVACGLVVGAGLVIVYGFNPMGDEWVCSDGEAPAGTDGFYNACYVQGSALPPGVSWDPFGNRPMSYNCDKDGWVPIERTVTHQRVSDVERDCVREGTELPGRWHIVREG